MKKNFNIILGKMALFVITIFLLVLIVSSYKVNATLSTFNRIIYEKDIVSDVNNYYLFNLPTNGDIMGSNDSTLYPIVQINNRQNDYIAYLKAERISNDTYLLYDKDNMLLMQNYQAGYDALGVYIYHIGNEFFMNIYILEANYDNTNNIYYYSLKYKIEDRIDIGGEDYIHTIKIGALGLGNIYVGGGIQNDQAVVATFNNYLKVETGGIYSAYSSGYDVGYEAGQEGQNAISPFWNTLTGIFQSVGAIMSIELMPHITIGLFILVPLFFIMVLAILSIWRKNW